eukprot:5247691-Prymnesium_polylepis.1
MKSIPYATKSGATVGLWGESSVPCLACHCQFPQSAVKLLDSSRRKGKLLCGCPYARGPAPIRCRALGKQGHGVFTAANRCEKGTPGSNQCTL